MGVIMATPWNATSFGAEARDALGDLIREVPGWRTRNRGTRGDGWGPVHGVMVHHTATRDLRATLDTVRDGRPDLPGPLYQMVVDRAGGVHLVGWGRANHAGSGSGAVLQAVIREDPRLPSPVGGPQVDGNARFYGIAMIHPGDSSTYPVVQVASVATAAALICAYHGWSQRSVVGHREWTAGKPDPSMSMATIRERVQRRLPAMMDQLRISL